MVQKTNELKNYRTALENMEILEGKSEVQSRLCKKRDLRNTGQMSQERKDYYNALEKLAIHEGRSVQEVREYHQTEADKKKYRISTWMNRGLIEEDPDSLYDYYLTKLKCDACECELVEGPRCGESKILDIDRDTHEFRGIVCLECMAYLYEDDIISSRCTCK